MIDVPGVDFGRHDHARTAESLPVSSGQFTAPFGPSREKGKTGAQYRGLHLVEPAVHPELDVVITIGLPAVAQPLEPVGQGGVISGDRAGVTERTEILRGIEAECSGLTERADRAAGRRRQMRLARVLDECERVPFGNRLEVRHIGRLPVKVDRHQCRGARSDGRLGRTRIERQPLGVDVREDGRRAGHHDGEG
jgi:hypothetical protein